MTKLLAFSPAISGKLVLLLAISGKLVLLPAIPGKLVFSPAIPYNKRLHPASVFSDRQLQCSFSFFSFYSVRIFASRSISFQALTPKPITISGSHTQTNHNLRRSHPSQSQFQALTSARRSTRPTVPSDHHYDKP